VLKKIPKKIPFHQKSIFIEVIQKLLAESMNQKRSERIDVYKEPDLFYNVVHTNNGDHVDISRGKSNLASINLSTFYITYGRLLTFEEKKKFSQWGGLSSNNISDDEHKRAFALAEIQLFMEAEERKLDVPLVIYQGGRFLREESIPSIDLEFTPEIIELLLNPLKLKENKYI
jgi:hypothetical protein